MKVTTSFPGLYRTSITERERGREKQVGEKPGKEVDQATEESIYLVCHDSL